MRKRFSPVEFLVILLVAVLLSGLSVPGRGASPGFAWPVALMGAAQAQEALPDVDIGAANHGKIRPGWHLYGYGYGYGIVGGSSLSLIEPRRGVGPGAAARPGVAMPKAGVVRREPMSAIRSITPSATPTTARRTIRRREASNSCSRATTTAMTACGACPIAAPSPTPTTIPPLS